MAEWFATGRIVDAILVLVAAEAAILLAFRWRTGRGPAPVPLLCNLVSGAALMLAVRAALVQSPWPVVAGWMLVSLGAHLGDLVPRLRNPAGLTLGRTGAPGVPGTSDAAAAFNARPRSRIIMLLTCHNRRLGIMRGFLALAATSGFLLGSSLPIAAFAQEAAGGASQDLVKRGEYLVTAGDCVACHTGPSGKRLAGNYVLNTPIGKIRTPNLTPDDETGLGKWTEADFVKAMHEGIDNEGHYLYPAFPFAWYTKVTTDDVKAIWAYLRSLEPVKEPRKDSEIPFPFNIRTALITWRTAFFTPGEWKPDPNATAEVNRGGYLVEGLGHCGMCHNENKIVGNSSLAGKLGGGVIDGWYAPNITPDGHQGIGAWTEEQVVTYLKTGTAPGDKPGVAAGPMRQTIEESLSKMTDADLKAMVAYLRTYQAKQTYKSKDLQAYDTTGAPGAGVYLSYCSSCHQPDGKGVEGAIPALAGNTSVQSAGPETVLRVIYGGLGAQSGYAPMTAIGQGMTDQQVADVTDYIRNSWGNSAPVLKSGVAADARKATSTMLAGNAPCAEIEQPDVAKAVADAGAAEQLKGLKQEDFIPRIDALLPKIKSALPAGRDDDIVNGLTTAFCKAAKPETDDVKLPWHATIGSFSNLVYSQLKHPERQASTMPAPAMPKPN